MAAILALMIWVRTPWRRDQEQPVDQPVQFDHRHHVQDDGIDCLYCHFTADKAATAGIPSTEKCMGCHSQIWQSSVMLEPVRRSYFSGLPIPWNRVHDLPGFAYFNHAAHTNRGVGCVECHGRVDKMGLVFQVAPLTMSWCLGCHRDPGPRLRPLSKITDMSWDPGPDRERIGREIQQQLGVQPLTDCSSCHR